MSDFGFGAVKFKATLNSFFDRDSILAPAKKAEKTVLGKIGGYCRKVAMNSIKKADGETTRAGKFKAGHVAIGSVSQPGDPPFCHPGSLGANKKGVGRSYRDFIFYSYDASSHSVYIGPCLLNGSGGPDVCKTLEYGGDELIWVTALGKRVQVMAHFEARPHMRPALIATITSKKFEDVLKDCVTNEAGTSMRMK